MFRVSRILSMISMLLSVLIAYGQFPGAGTRGQTGSGGFGSPQGNFQDTVQRPPFDYQAYDLSDVRQVLSGTIDTLIHQLHIVEPYFVPPFIGGNLGSEISSLHPFLFEYDPSALDLGQNHYSHLLKQEDFNRIYITNRDWFEGRYSPAYFLDNNAQGDGVSFGLDFYKTFARKITLNLRYQSANDFGIRQTSGTSRASQIAMKQLDVKLMQRSKNDRRITYVHYHNPRIEENVVGTSQLFATIYSQNQNFEIGNSILFGDSLALEKEKIRWDSKLSFKKEVYRLTDASVNEEEQAFYGFDTIPDNLRYANDVRRVVFDNRFSSSLDNLNYSFGLSYEQVSLLQQDTVEVASLNFLNAYGSGTYQLSPASTINAELSIGVGDISGDRRLQFNYVYQRDNVVFRVGGRANEYSPTSMHRFSLLGQLEQTEREFTTTSRQGIFGTIHFPNLNMGVSGALDSYSNFLFPNFSNWRQRNDGFTAYHITLQKALTLGPFQTQHNIAYQQISTELVPRGQLQYHGNVYVQSHLFKKNMFVHLGADIYVIPSYDQPVFHPLFGTFFRNEASIGVTRNLVMLNPYLNCQVDRFHFFIKGINVLRQVLPQSPELVATYPSYPLRLRIGLRWSLLD